MTNWKKYLLADIVDDIAMGPFGSNLKINNFIEKGVPVIRGMNLNDGGFTNNSFAFVSEEKAQSLKRCLAYPDDLVFTHRGTLGQVAIIPKNGFEKYLVSQSQMRLTVNKKLLVPKFLFYFFKSAIGQNQLLKNVSQVGVPAIANPTKSLKQVELTLPEIAEQERIISILSSLDNKIELNLQMNQSLEAMAQAIFKQWFVKFKFPNFDGVMENGLPKGWKKKTIGEVAKNIQYGFTQSSSSEKVGPKFLRITDIQRGEINWDDVPYCKTTESEFKKYKIQNHDIFIARTGASTGENVYVINPPEAVFASYLIRLQFDKPSLANYVGKFLRRPEYFNYIAAIVGGSAQPNANAKQLTAVEIKVPTEKILDKYFEITNKLNEKINSNYQQNQTLTQLRDSLLPKLMTGKIQVL